jgi:hypothetical protein
MANEITATVNISCVNGSFRQAFQPATKQITQAAIGGHITVWNVGTSEEDLTVGDVSTLGVMGLLNTDTANYVQIGPKSGGAMVASMRLKPGEPNFIRCEPGTTYRAIANTAACKVLVWLLEN